MTIDIYLHHFVFSIIFIILHIYSVCYFANFYMIIEFGHTLHFSCVILYKMGASTKSWYRPYYKLVMIIFPLVRIVGFIIVTCLMIGSLQKSTLDTIPTEILSIVGVLVFISFILQFRFAFDIWKKFKKL